MNYLIDKIHEQAVEQVENELNQMPKGEKTRRDYQKLQNTAEFKQLKTDLIEDRENQLTNSILKHFEDFKGLVESVSSNDKF